MPNQTIAQGKTKAPFLSDAKQASIQLDHTRNLTSEWWGYKIAWKTSVIVKQALSVKEMIGKGLSFHACLDFKKGGTD